MRKLLSVVLFVAGLGLIGWAVVVGWQSPERLPEWVQRRPSIYLKVALGAMERMAASPVPVDWPVVAEQARALAREAKTPADTYPAIRLALRALGEGQAQLVPPAPAPPAAPEAQGAYGLQVLFPERVVAIVFPTSPADAAGIGPGDVIERVDGREPIASADPRTLGRFIELPRPQVTLQVRRGSDVRDVPLAIGSLRTLPAETGRLGHDVGYVTMPGTSADEPFAERVQSAIAVADAPAVCGWIVDLRRNNGGALLPALLALRTILGEGPLGALIARDGTRTSLEYPTTGAGSAPPVAPLRRPNPTVAILTSRLTANAGEIVSIAFRGRPGARVFGEPTWGASSGRTSVRLPDDAHLELPTTLAADRQGKIYTGPIAPDEAAPVNWALAGTSQDPVLIQAGTWIRNQDACKKQ